MENLNLKDPSVCRASQCVFQDLWRKRASSPLLVIKIKRCRNDFEKELAQKTMMALYF
jgi:hypothetical protein